MFNFIKTEIEGLYVIEPQVFGDHRGYFMETYNEKDFVNNGLKYVFVQDNQSKSTKGVLRGGGDTKMLMITDNVFLWVLSLPLGILAGFVLHWSAFWIYVCLNSADVVKTFWCVFRLKSEKWIKKISTGKE